MRDSIFPVLCLFLICQQVLFEIHLALSQSSTMNANKENNTNKIIKIPFIILTIRLAQFSCFCHSTVSIHICTVVNQYWDSTSLRATLHIFELFFCKKKNLLVGASSMLWVVDKSVSQWVSERVRDVCISHQSDWIYYKQLIKFLVVKVNGMWKIWFR